MSTKEMAEILELVNWLKEQADSQEGGPSSNLNKAAGIITSLSTRLEAAERELKESQSILGTCQIELTESEVELAQVKQTNAELMRDRERLTKQCDSLSELYEERKLAAFRLKDDKDRWDKIEAMIKVGGDGFCEVYLSGLRNVKDGQFTEAEAFQVESNPQKFETVSAPTLREAIDAAITKGTL